MNDRYPDFFIVGLPKCATTTVYRVLRTHPDIFMPDVKEPHHFGSDLTRDPLVYYIEAKRYLSLFDEARPGQKVGEASTNTLFSANACGEIHAQCPSARIIIMLRNLVDVLHASHAQYVFTGVESEPDLARALELEEGRRIGLNLPDRTNLREKLYYRTNLMRVPNQIRQFQEVFGHDGVCIVFTEDLASDPRAVYGRLFKFLGVDDHPVRGNNSVNRNATVRSQTLRELVLSGGPNLARLRHSLGLRPTGLLRLLARLNRREVQRPPLDPALRAALVEEFSRTVEDLAEVTARNLDHWKV